MTNRTVGKKGAIIRAALREKVPERVFQALEQADLLFGWVRSHSYYKIVSSTNGVIGFLHSPTPEAVAHALLEDPGCQIQAATQQEWEEFQEDK